MTQQTMLRCDSICKTFGPITALKGVSIEVRYGEVLGLVGENGSGKSTLASIIAGMQPADSGTITLIDEPFAPQSMLEAQRKGVAMVVQEMGTIPDISVASNIFLGNEKQFSKQGIFSNRAMTKAASKLMEELGVTTIDARANTSELNNERRKLVEISRAMYTEPKLFIVDETTTALSQMGRDIIYNLMRKLRGEGNSVLFISHDLGEVTEMCDRVTVLRDGEYIDTLEGERISEGTIRELMVGRQFVDHYYRTDNDGTSGVDVVLELQNVTLPAVLENFNLKLHSGEILGLAGMSECGMHEVGRVAFGIDKPLTGSAIYRKQNRRITNTRIALKCKVGYISKNRDVEALILHASIKDNILLPSYRLISKAGFISKRKEKSFAKAEVDRLRIKCSSVEQLADQLSGGNKQKVVFAKWMGNKSDIFIMDCPTRGIDVGVKAAMYQLIYDMKMEGKSVLLISEELPELIGMSDRIAVMKDGKIQKVFERSENPTEKAIISYMI